MVVRARHKVFSVAKPELGSKHQCQNCSTKFFDLNKDPIVCPKCGTTFQVATASAPPARASRAAPKEEDEETETEGGAEVVSLEDADQVDDGKVEAASTDDDDVEDDDTSNDDDSFLEEEDDDANVSDLIDGEVEDDEER